MLNRLIDVRDIRVGDVIFLLDHRHGSVEKVIAMDNTGLTMSDLGGDQGHETWEELLSYDEIKLLERKDLRPDARNAEFYFDAFKRVRVADEGGIEFRREYTIPTGPHDDPDAYTLTIPETGSRMDDNEVLSTEGRALTIEIIEKAYKRAINNGWNCWMNTGDIAVYIDDHGEYKQLCYEDYHNNEIKR